MVGDRSGTGHAAILGDDIPTENHQYGYSRVASPVDRFFPELPHIVHTVRIAAGFISVEVVDQQHIRPVLLVARTTGCIAIADGTERCVILGDKLLFRPFVYTHLFAIVGTDTRIVFQFLFVRIQQPFCSILRGRGHHYIVFAPGQHQE